MSKWKRGLLLLLAVSLMVSCVILPIQGEQADAPYLPPPSVSAQSAVLMLAQTGDRVYEKEADIRLPMASTTKIMTALVALDLADPDQVITVAPEAVGTEGSSIYLTEGEALTLEQLLYALLLESANDAAVAIACGVSGSVEKFAAEMNKKAAALGLKNTHFVNPHGLDHEEHYTTAYELAVITRHALQNPLFKTIVSTRKTTIPHESPDSARLLVNHNKMLRLYEGCIGVKTGFTKRSGRCLVSAAERDGVTLISVTINAPDDWDDHADLLDYGFSKYRSVILGQDEEYLFPLSVVGGMDDYVMIGNTEDLRVVLPADHGSIFVTIEAPRFTYAGVKSGEILGKVIFRCDVKGNGQPEKIGELALSARYSVEKRNAKKSFWQWLKSLFGID